MVECAGEEGVAHNRHINLLENTGVVVSHGICFYRGQLL
jgi:hypothetical protein